MKNIPNILTVLRLLACPILIYLFEAEYNLWILIIFILECLTDFFDGYLSRKGNYKTNFGKFLDPIADKTLILTMCFLIVFGMRLWQHMFELLFSIQFLIILIREIIVSFLRFNLSRWNKNKNIDVSRLSKYKTFIQMLAIGGLLGFCFYDFFNDNNYKLIIKIYGGFVIFLIWLAAIITVITGVQHYKTYLKLKQFEGKK